eukprot:3856573-Ditylum_brightwellii.AAC.1
MEGLDFHTNQVKKMTKQEYISRVQKILKSNIDGGKTTRATCAFAMPVLRYTFGIMKWTKVELCKLGIKTHKLLTMYGHHHPKASAHRLYLHQCQGVWGLTGCEDTHNYECTVLAQYVLDSMDKLTQVVCETATPTQKFLMKFASLPCYTSRDTVESSHLEGLHNKPLHGKFFAQQSEIPQ